MEILKRREKEILEILMTVESVKAAAEKMAPALTDRAIYNILYRLRKRQIEARNFVNQLLSYRRRSDLLDKLLTPKTAVSIEETTPEENIS